MTDEHPTSPRFLQIPDLKINECNDGTICENSSPCISHPTKEGAYMCDCFQAHGGSNSLIKYAGVYCEHPATSYCETGVDTSAHAFCTNGGTCIRSVSKTEVHAGCDCPRGYDGNYCQFIQGSMPSDWTIDNFMHPELHSLYGANQDSGIGPMLGIVIGAAVAVGAMAFIVVGYVYGPKLKSKLVRSEKEMDTASEADGAESAASRPKSTSSFVGGQSVYKKKNSTGQFVTADTLEADGAVLTEALGDIQNTGSMDGLEDVDVEPKTSMEEVDLDDDNKPGEMA
mmetsp:Transcript_26354/g.33709  ORF Transcript_26354/g.33709 Transcript_26354/m.33709 type:complete len:284 (-) Transcript_26354:250-1101(-)